MNILGNPVRLAMLKRLADGPLSGSAVAMELQISPRAVSSHMHMLKCAEFVSERSSDTNKIYEISQAGLAAARPARIELRGKPTTTRRAK